MFILLYYSLSFARVHVFPKRSIQPFIILSHNAFPFADATYVARGNGGCGFPYEKVGDGHTSRLLVSLREFMTKR